MQWEAVRGEAADLSKVSDNSINTQGAEEGVLTQTHCP